MDVTETPIERPQKKQKDFLGVKEVIILENPN
jgi:hypothetical protein